MNLLAQLPHPIIFAHRGASCCAPENTMAAFELAIEQGADAIELDAKLTRDGHVVVIHDQTVDRTTQGTGNVGEMNLSELRELDAGSFFDIQYKDQNIPTLAEVLETFGQRTFTNIELTNYASTSDDLPEKVAALVKRFKLEERVLFSSFNPQALRRAKKALPEVPAGWLALPGWKGSLVRGWLGRLLIDYQALHPEQGDVTKNLVRKAHQHKKRVHVYTVNLPEEMQRLFNVGVDGIFTDDPQLARQVLTQSKDIP